MNEHSLYNRRRMSWTLRDMPNLRGRTAVITGASGGLGFETARALARRGAHVVIAVRSVDKGRAAADVIRREVPSASLDIRALDLDALASVRTFAEGVLADGPAVDILVNNAGVMAIPRQLTADGFERQLGVNHLAHFALTCHLMPALVRAPAARVVCVSSSARLFGEPIDQADPQMTKAYGAWRAYARSKLANARFAIELDARAQAAGLRLAAFAADPGFAATDLQAHSARSTGEFTQRFAHGLVRLAGSTPLRGALPQLRAATDPDARRGSVYGLRWVARGAPVRVPLTRRERDAAARADMWRTSEHLTGVRFDVADFARRAPSGARDDAS
jgi:NAD(P)-dependent dehydrogenase (short-subunit alcohol dehydrogenase family)